MGIEVCGRGGFWRKGLDGTARCDKARTGRALSLRVGGPGSFELVLKWPLFIGLRWIIANPGYMSGYRASCAGIASALLETRVSASYPHDQ